MQISQKQKKISQCFAPLLKSTSNFEHFDTNDDSYGLCISEIRDCQKCD